MDTIEAITVDASGNAPDGARAFVLAGLWTRVAARTRRLRWRFVINGTRIALCDLTDEQLADIGISRHEAETEASRSWWF